MKNRRIQVSAVVILLTTIFSCGGGEEGATSKVDNYYDSVDASDYASYSITESEEGEVEMPSDFETPLNNGNFNTEEYAYLPENNFMSPGLNPLSTFSIDVDNASYTNCRRT